MPNKINEVKYEWASCEVNPNTGIAQFDDIIIHADPITATRWDRVFAILEEEQVVMCRQMIPRLTEQPGALALDIGTGSGIFAIWAAKHGCRSLALDVSPRAVKIARENVLRNGLNLVETPEELKPGSVCILHERFDEYFIDKWNEKFHIATMNPPYNPTFAGVYPALHCEAGEDGQRVFREQINLIPSILDNGGWCIGDQFTIVESNGENDALKLINNAFGDESIVNWAWLIPGTIPVKEFLSKQYEAYLKQPLKPGSIDSIVDYITRMNADGRHFAVVYFEVCKQLPHANTPRVQEFELLHTPGFSWDARIWEHRCFVEYTSPLSDIEV